MCVFDVCAQVHTPKHMYGGQMTTLQNQFYPSFYMGSWALTNSLKLIYIFSYLLLFVYGCAYATMFMWKLEDNLQKWILSFHHAGGEGLN